MNTKRQPQESSVLARVASLTGIAFVVAAYVLAVVNMVRTGGQEQWGEKKVVRICHWQLELGYRDGIEYVIREFEKRNPDVKIIQIPIYERIYAQYINTQLMGGTAPDIIELGMVNIDQLERMLGRYFLPFSPWLKVPNDFNAGNDFAATPWINTFRDGLRSQWSEKNLDYYSVSFSAYTMRIYYNATLYRAITGRDAPPADYRELLAVCEQTKKYADSSGRVILPFAASDNTAGFLRDTYRRAMTVSYYSNQVAGNLDYNNTTDESFLAYVNGRYSPDDPQLRAAEEISRRLAVSYYPKGFMALKRMESVFAFVQQRALMLVTGSWDMGSLSSQAHEAGFELAVMDVPLPSRDDPQYGAYVGGVPSESDLNTSKYGICRFSKHPEVALAFLKFATSKEINERMNERMQLIPSISGTYVSDLMKPFIPHTDGAPVLAYPSLFHFGPKTELNEKQAFWEYVSGTTDYDQFTATLGRRLIPDGMDDFLQKTVESYNSLLPLDQQRSSYSVRLAFTTDSTAAAALTAKLVYTTDSYCLQHAAIETNIYGLLDAAAHGNTPRIEELKKSFGYKKMVDEFARVNPEP